VTAILGRLRARAVLADAQRLLPSHAAHIVRCWDGGDIIITDGPPAQTREQLTGWVIAECQNLDATVRMAPTIPAAWYGSVEVTPVVANSFHGATTVPPNPACPFPHQANSASPPAAVAAARYGRRRRWPARSRCRARSARRSGPQLVRNGEARSGMHYHLRWRCPGQDCRHTIAPIEMGKDKTRNCGGCGDAAARASTSAQLRLSLVGPG
jgi:hypothetical protein